MRALKRRTLLQASAGLLAAPQIMAQSKPEKLVYVGDNGPWHYAMVEEVAPAFEKATGIKIDFTLLPVDPWRARLRAELGAGSSGIDIVQWLGQHDRLDRRRTWRTTSRCWRRSSRSTPTSTGTTT